MMNTDESFVVEGVGRFCGDCGGPLVVASEEIIRERNLRGGLYCPSCGKSFEMGDDV